MKIDRKKYLARIAGGTPITTSQWDGGATLGEKKKRSNAGNERADENAAAPPVNVRQPPGAYPP